MGILKWLLTACLMLAFMVLGLKSEPKSAREQDSSAKLTIQTRAA